MKKYLITLAAFLAVVGTAYATPTSWDWTGSVLQPLTPMRTGEVRVPHITATSTATSTITGPAVFGSTAINSVTTELLTLFGRNVGTTTLKIRAIDGAGLHNNGTLMFTDTSSTNVVTRTWGLQANSLAGALRFLYSASNENLDTELARFTTAGNFGIGTTAPAVRLSVAGDIRSTGSIDTDVQFLGQAADTVSAPSFSWSGDTNTGFYRSAEDTLGIVTGGVERFRVDSAGRVTIGNPTAAAYLTIAGNSAVQPTILDDGNMLMAANSHMYFVIDADNNNTNRFFSWAHNGTTSGAITELARMDDAGDFSLGTTTTPSRLYVQSANAGTAVTVVDNNSNTLLNITNAGAVTANGAWDYGAATSLEIPNGTAPTVDASGECAWDTTDDQLVCGDSGNNARVVAHDEFKLKDVTIASSSAVFFNGGVLPIGSHKDGLELTQYRCFVTGGTSVVLSLSDGTNATETITCGTSVTSDTDVATNDTFTADEIMNLNFGAITGAVNYVHFEAYARITRE